MTATGQCWLIHGTLLTGAVPLLCRVGGKTKGHKGRPKHYLTEAEIRAEEDRKKKEREWKVMLCMVDTYWVDAVPVYSRTHFMCCVLPCLVDSKRRVEVWKTRRGQVRRRR